MTTVANCLETDSVRQPTNGNSGSYPLFMSPLLIDLTNMSLKIPPPKLSSFQIKWLNNHLMTTTLFHVIRDFCKRAHSFKMDVTSNLCSLKKLLSYGNDSGDITKRYFFNEETHKKSQRTLINATS